MVEDKNKSNDENNLITPLKDKNRTGRNSNLQFSRAFLLAISMVVFVITFLIPLILVEPTSGFFFAGGLLGITSSGIVLIVYMQSEWKTSSSNSLLFFRALCDMGIGFRFVLDSYFNHTLCGNDNCKIDEHSLSENDIFRKCAAPSGMVEFFELASEMWFFCLAFDLAISITNPFSSLSQRMKWYHLFSWSFGLGMALILTLNKGLLGFWYIDEGVDETAICWIKSSQNGNRVNYRTWVFLYIPLIIVYVYCIRVLFGAYSHLSKGISKTFQHRVRVLVMNSLNIGIYMAYWAVLGFFYALAYGFSNSSPTLSRWFWRVVMFIISSKGFADWLVFILVSDANVLTSDHATESLDFNGALRQEVLHYATTGIRECAARKSPTPAKRKLVLLMTQKNTPLTNILTLQHLIALVFKGENIAQNVHAVNSAQTPEESMQLETVMHHVEDESERLSESAPPSATKMKRRSTLSRKIAVPDGYEKEAGSAPNSVNLEVENRELSIESHHVGREASSASQRTLGSWVSPFKLSANTPSTRNTISLNFNFTHFLPIGQTDKDPSPGEELPSPYEADRRQAISTAGEDRDTVDFTGSSTSTCLGWIQDILSWPSDLLTTFSMKRSVDASVEFVEYEPYYFRDIRLSSGVQDDDYITSFMKTIKERLTEGGASGAFFFFTKDEKFIAKSCTLDEIAHIRRSSLMLSKYFQDNPESFITRIYGAYKLRIYGTSFYFFVTNNIFLNPNDEVINEKYDLKGSWVKRNSSPPQMGQRVTCTHCNQKYTFLGKKRKKQKSYKMLKLPRSTNNLTGEEEIDTSRCPMQVLGHHEPNVILKDNDLKHKIRLPGMTARFLLQQLEKDSELLCSFGVMDYSLLVGVHNTEYFVDDPSICAPESPNHTLTSSTEVKSILKTSVRKIDVDGRHMSTDSLPRRSSILHPRNGRLQVSRIVGPDAYYMGIVDFQQLYNFEKKLERFFKIYFKGEPPEGLSCMEPIGYRLRFLRRMEELLELEEVPVEQHA